MKLGGWSRGQDLRRVGAWEINHDQTILYKKRI